MLTKELIATVQKNVEALLKYQKSDDPKSMLYYYRGREYDQSMGGINSVYFQEYYNAEEIAALGLPEDRKDAIEVLLTLCINLGDDEGGFCFDLLRKNFSEKDDLLLIEEFFYHPNSDIGYYALTLLEEIYDVDYLSIGIEFIRLIEEHLKSLTGFKLRKTALSSVRCVLLSVEFKDFPWKDMIFSNESTERSFFEKQMRIC